MDAQSPDAQSWRAGRFSQRAGGRAKPARGPADCGTGVRRDQERAELAGRVPATGGRLRSVRQRQDRDQGDAGPLRRGRVLHHRPRREPAAIDGAASASRNWNDSFYPVGDPRRGNFTPDCDLANVAANGECGPANHSTFGQIIVRTRYDEALTEGFGVRPYNWVASLSVQHELVPGLSVSGGYFRRWNGNFNIMSGNTPVTQNLAVTNADFTSLLHHGARGSAAAWRRRQSAVRILRRERGEVRPGRTT